MKQMEKMNEAVGMKNCVMMGGGGDSPSFQKARVLEIYWLCSIGIHLWGEMVKDLE